MNDLNIQAAALLSGVTVHQIRAWERRYEAVTPRRLGNNFRAYSKEDVKKLKLLGILINNGITISKIAKMSADELQVYHDSLELVPKSAPQPIQESMANNMDKLNFLMNFLVTNKIDILKHEVLKFESLTSISDIIVPLTRKVLLFSDLKDDKIQDLLSTLIEQINKISSQATKR